MARGGINKALVSNARETLISRGENPSIDAIEGRPSFVKFGPNHSQLINLYK